MKISLYRMQEEGAIRPGDGVTIEGHGNCMVIRIDDAAAGRFTALSKQGVEIPLTVHIPGQTHGATRTLQ